MKHKIPYLFLAIAFTILALAGLAGCSDWYSEPVVLKDQRALSAVYEDRPLYSTVYYEGQYNYQGEEVRVFVVEAVSKFTAQSSFYIYYMPASGITIATDPGRFPGGESLRKTHELVYDHDQGRFRLRANRRDVEVIKANFTEAYSLKESRCLKAIEAADGNPDDYPGTKYAAETCFWSGNFDQSKTFTQLLKENIDHFDHYATRGQMLHDYHTLMGRHLLREGNTGGAKQQLLLSVGVEPSPSMRTFGPNMELAMDLLKAGEIASVLEYLDVCAGFWNEEPVRIWKQKINAGRLPILNQYSWDGELEVAPANQSACLAAYRGNDAEAAFSVCRDAAVSGDGEAQNLVGVLFEAGKGTPQDFPQAMHWYQLSADQGEKYGQYNLAQLYRTGKAGAPDLDKAVHYYALSAEQGYGEAQFSLGVMHFEGSGTPVDMEQARKWWTAALENGVARAENALRRLPE